MPRLTIAIPTLNRADLLGRAIESALAQSSTDIEVIVSDNGSTDETPGVIARYANRGLRSFRHESTMSAPRHGQFLIEQARGEFFLGLSDDDYLEPDFAARVLAAFDLHPETSFVYTGCAVHYEEVQVPALVGPPLEQGLNFMAAHYAGKRELSWCACVTRVGDLRELGPQPENRIVGDMFFWTKLAFRGPVGCVPQVLSHYVLFRSRNDNISHGTSPLLWASEAKVLADEVLQMARGAGADRDYLARLETQARKHIARSAANQFVWTRIKGATRLEALKWSWECRPYLSWTLPAVTRLGAALVLPRKTLRSALLKSAARLAETRRAQPNAQIEG